MHHANIEYGIAQSQLAASAARTASETPPVADATPIRILHLEDDADDAALTAALLRKGGVLCSIQRVVDKDEFTEALDSGAVDIILSDMSLPRFNGMDALAIARERHPLVPFIFLSGNMGEETAIDTLLEGASDYVLKHRMKRLVPAVRRVLKEAEELRKREEAEAEIRRMQDWANRISSIISHSPIVAFSWTPMPGWPVSFVSDNVRQFGYIPEDFLTYGLLYASIIHPDDLPVLEEAVREFISTTQTEMTTEYRILHKDGSVRWVEDHTTVSRNADNSLATIDGLVVDITERKGHQIEQELNTARMQMLYELASKEDDDEAALLDHVLNKAVSLTGSAIGYFHFLDPVSGRIAESRWTENVPAKCRHIEHPCVCFDRVELWTTCVQTRQPQIRSGNGIPEDACLVHSKQSARFMRHAVVPVMDGGTVVMLAGVGEKAEAYNESDLRLLQLIMLEMWRMRKRIRATMELKKLSRAVEYSPASIVITDVHGNIEYVNPRLESMSGYSSEELLGKHVRIFRSGEQNEDYYNDLWSRILAGQVWRGTLRNRKKDGSLYWESLFIAPIADHKGDIVNFVAVKEDVSERIEAEQSLINARAEAERAARIKDQFIALISHEIRTPLNVIFGYSGLIREVYTELIQPLDHYMFEAIEDAGKRLMRTVDLLLAASSLGAGSYTPVFEEFEAMSTLERLLQQYYYTAHQKDLYLECHVHTDRVPLRLDRLGFEQSIQNLVDNALKFTTTGGVFITTAEEEKQLRIDIRDTGPGMSQEFITRAFHPFTQESEGYSRPFEGLGLGLALVKQYIEINGGRISVQSEPGKGSVFSVYFPLPT
ncbi:MAG: PAS domain S-box protein [Bacteroidia bacterium]|nr:PAS domain S-box protein [Bacteroidia bacterium]